MNGNVDNEVKVMESSPEGNFAYQLIERLFPICRSITGDGVRETLGILRGYLPDIEIHEVPSGTQCCDWVVPDEWNIRDAYIMDASGKRVVDFRDNNLHVVGYSTPVDMEISTQELQEHLFSKPEQPDAIPYIISYYKPFWGFCLTENKRSQLCDERYRVVIDSELAPGHLTYADLYIPGKTKEQVFVSAYVCHPSMANNELSGPTMATTLAKWVQSAERHYSYYFVWVPETIGAVVHLSRERESLTKNTVAAFNLTCVGDDRATSFLPSKQGNSLADRVARHALEHLDRGFDEYDFARDRGSLERQYCAPGADLPMVSIMGSKYGTYPEYHTSLDDLSVVSPAGLQGNFDLHRDCIRFIEANRNYQTTVVGEPQLSRRDLPDEVGFAQAPPVGHGAAAGSVRRMIPNFLMFCDGNSDLIEIAEKIGVYTEELLPLIDVLLTHGLIEEA